MALAPQEVNRTEQDYSNFLHLNIRGIQPFDFSLSIENQKKLIEKGYSETMKFIESKLKNEVISQKKLAL